MHCSFGWTVSCAAPGGIELPASPTVGWVDWRDRRWGGNRLIRCSLTLAGIAPDRSYVGDLSISFARGSSMATRALCQMPCRLLAWRAQRFAV